MIESFFFLILLLFLLLLIVVLNFVFQFDWFEPSIIMTSTMFLSVLLAYFSMNKWCYNISSITFFAISLGYFSFFLGSIYIFFVLKNSIVKTNSYSYNNIQFFDNNIMLFCLSVFMIILAIFSFKEIYNLLLSLNKHDGFFGIIKTVRYALERQEINFSRYMIYRFLIAKVISYTFLYIFCFKIFFDSFKFQNLKFLIPCALFIPFKKKTIFSFI